MNDTRKYPQAEVKILYGGAAGRCAFESCRMFLILPEDGNDKTKQIGIIAHIIAHSPNGPRANPKYPKNKLDAYENWILLCPTCHATVDAHKEKYTIEILHEIKRKHETWVKQQLDNGMSLVGFAELEIATKAIASGQHTIDATFQLICPQEKIIKNKLTVMSQQLITIGLSKSYEVRNFLLQQALLDQYFPERLKVGFQKKYAELKQQLNGDVLFIAMFDFAKAGKTEFTQQAASLAVLCHLFELCEIFEK